MISTFLILFFISLVGIAGMIGRKVLVLRKVGVENIISGDQIIFEGVDLDGIKHVTVKNAKKIGFYTLVTILRLSIKGHHFAKQKGKDTVEYIKKTLIKKDAETGEPKEVSKFLRTMSAYKQKIRKIKREIKEEEGIE